MPEPPHQLQQQPALQNAPEAALQDSLPPWLEWPRFLSEVRDADRPPPAGSSAVPVGTRRAPVGREVPVPTGRRRALLIGVSYFGTPAELSGSLRDVEEVRAVLLRVGFSSERVLCLTDGQQDPMYQPTHRNIIAAMRWLAQGVVAGDVLFFHFSGHGAQQQDPDADHAEGDALDDALCPVDVQQAGQITDNQAFELMVQNLPMGVRLTALVDCCLPCSCLELPFVCDPRRGWIEDPNPQHVVCDAICFSAAPDEELSPEELRALRGRPSGPVTTAFLQALQELAGQRRGPISYLELLAQVQAQLSAAGLKRRPQLSSSQAFNPVKRAFRFFDATPNGNAEVGLRSRRQHRSLR